MQVTGRSALAKAMFCACCTAAPDDVQMAEVEAQSSLEVLQDSAGQGFSFSFIPARSCDRHQRGEGGGAEGAACGRLPG